MPAPNQSRTPTKPPDRRPDVDVERIYGSVSKGARRVLVDRLWPRGIAKAEAPIDEWFKEVAPSTELRRWYGHDPDKFDEFARRYNAELETLPAAEWFDRLRRLGGEGRLVLVTATRDVDISAARVLRDRLLGS
jgi:uncharacterized protein YeaO (DUF488 family)